MYSFVIRVAIDINKAVELINTIPMLGLNNDFVETFFLDPDPNKKTYVIFFNVTFSLFKLLYFFLIYSLSILGLFNIFS